MQKFFSEMLEKYWQLKEKSRIFDKLIHTINAYQPDLVFIFNWACDKHLFLEGLSYDERKINLINDQFVVYDLLDKNTKIIWTVHPNNLRFQGYNVDELIQAIIDNI